MADFTDEDLSGSRLTRVDLSNTRFERVHLEHVELIDSEMYDMTIRGTDLVGVRMHGVEIVDLDIVGEVVKLTVNGIDVASFVQEELDRRHPGRAAMRPTDPDGFRAAWDLLEELWAGTVERARRLDPAVLHESVDGEWSFIETLRHLAFATDAWLSRAILGDPSPWHPLELPWDQMPDTPGIPRDRAARPSLEEVLELRESRRDAVRRYLDELTQETLDGDTEPIDGPGWPPPESFPVAQCLRTILNEEWEHRLYAERDLAILETRT
ncbi:DinB family protein [Nocardioides sp. cx-173]|uniref:DinB family protein n=1 Tax=Nocardioides sp. cx-173 TaxID=2898796 RepID=UPI001E54728B|nr:DinB family protein [Nocardioides sp. cx-173]MCD4524347.1 DinB family protein [Nocardioides sp. cx-173]UGB43165.1 DinB family protein [Nocardioides sp. cx-173]